MMKIRIFPLILLTVLLTGCSKPEAAPPTTPTAACTQTLPPETTCLPETEPTEKATLEPFYLDEYGIRYVLTEENEYCIDEEYREDVDTPESSAFTKISYYPYGQELTVTFRSSGASYVYQAVPPDVWAALKAADSRGRFYNSQIKGCYQGKKI